MCLKLPARLFLCTCNVCRIQRSMGVSCASSRVTEFGHVMQTGDERLAQKQLHSSLAVIRRQCMVIGTHAAGPHSTSCTQPHCSNLWSRQQRKMLVFDANPMDLSSLSQRSAVVTSLMLAGCDFLVEAWNPMTYHLATLQSRCKLLFLSIACRRLSDTLYIDSLSSSSCMPYLVS